MQCWDLFVDWVKYIIVPPPLGGVLRKYPELHLIQLNASNFLKVSGCYFLLVNRQLSTLM